MKQIIIPFLLICFLSCNKDKSNSSFYNNSESNETVKNNKLTSNFDEDKSVNDLFDIQDYKKLSVDKVYQEFVEDFYEMNISMNIKLFKQNELNAAIGILDSKMNKNTKDDPMGQAEKLGDLANLARKAVGSAYTVGKDAYQLIKIEKRKKELDNSFSDEKKQIVFIFEKQLNTIIDYSCNFPKNPKVKKNDIFQNYKSVGPSLKNDDEITDYLDPLIEKMDKFLIEGVNVKSKIKLNSILNPDFDNLSIVDYAERIMSAKGDFDVDCDSNLLNDYFDLLNEIQKTLNQQELSVPIEDWSEEKQKNFIFIIDDINIKISNEIKSLKI